MMKRHVLDILETKLAQLLKCNLLPEKSYLAGGTAVYLYLKYRVSVDLDFFTPTAFNSDLLIHKIKGQEKGTDRKKRKRDRQELDPEKLEEFGIGNRISHCCPDIPVGCIGQPGGCGDWHFPGLEVRETMPNHQE
ncbi:MAG: nucleotidyl transferase AbiEii/AbiGii toxin family protein [Candidatus Aminicenantes bacterium]|nr:MAG: nucleotidyl transferase AbiEii/AbiGii toxin family protein [Candidatus Aminicenantes bacterium]